MAGARRDAADANSESDVNSESRLIYSAAEKPAMRWDSHLTTHHHMPCLLYTSPSPRDS